MEKSAADKSSVYAQSRSATTRRSDAVRISRLEQVLGLPIGTFMLLTGFGFWWGFHDFSRAAGSHLLPLESVPFGAVLPERLAMTAGFTVGMIIIAVFSSRIGSIRHRTKLLVGTVALEVGSTAIVYLIAYIPVPRLPWLSPAIQFVGGVASTFLFIAWFDLYARFGSDNIRLVLPACLLVNALTIAVLFGLHLFLSSIAVIIIQLLVLPLSLLLLILARRREPESKCVKLADSIAFPNKLTLAILLFGIVFGFILNVVASSITEAQHFGVCLDIVGIAIAAIIFFCMALPNWHRPARLLNVYPVVVPLMLMGVLFFPIAQSSMPFASSALTWCGYAYFDLLMMLLYTKMSNTLLVSPVAVNAHGQALDNFGILIGMLLGIFLAKPMAIYPNLETVVIAVIVIAVCIVSMRCITERDFETIWGLYKLPPQRFYQNELTDACKALGEAAQLTSRESEILLLLVDGNRTDQIAQKLSLSSKTVRTHTHNIYYKLDVHSFSELSSLVEARIEKR